MSDRPKVLHVGGTLYWVIRTRNPDTMVLKDADSTPTVAVRKNGASVGDSVTVTKRSATTGIYDCSYNPAGEVEGDEFTIEESATVTGTTQDTYDNSWEFTVIAVERGTDGANTTTPPTSEAIATTILDTSLSGHNTPGTVGEWINNVSDSLALLLTRITAGVATMFGDLITMITGSGTSGAKWTTSSLEAAITSGGTSSIERSVSDTDSIRFSWPVAGATITAQKSMNNEEYVNTVGTISFVRTESDKHYYSLSYDPADRDTVESSIRYKLTDGTYTKYFNLRLVPPGVTPEQIEEQLADNFQEVINAVSSPTNSEKVLVDENYGGANRLTYMLRGRPISDATIEVYLYSDYLLGRFNDAYRLDRTRQKIDGTWEKPFYLDPDGYAIRFNKSGVAGPDDYYVVVSFEESEIRIEKI